jgi:hypothetical protein
MKNEWSCISIPKYVFVAWCSVKAQLQLYFTWKRPLGRPRRRWEDSIKMDLTEIGIDGANWIQLAQDRVQWRACVNTVINLRVP